MRRPLFTVPVRDLERSDQRRSWEIPAEWLDWALSESEAKSDGAPGTLELYLKKNGREILVKGEAKAGVTMPCARTLEPVPVRLEAEIMLLLTPRAPSPAQGRKGGPRRQRPKEPEGEDAELLTREQAARDEYEGDTVELDEFVREHLLLELPLFPVRSDLPFESAPATDTRPDDSGSRVDPRLAPLAALAEQLQQAGTRKVPGSDG